MFDYSIRFYDRAKKYVEAIAKTISLENSAGCLALSRSRMRRETFIHEAPIPVWANFRQRALDVAILEINAKTDLKMVVGEQRSRDRFKQISSNLFEDSRYIFWCEVMFFASKLLECMIR
jgi:hypothetical protein